MQRGRFIFAAALALVAASAHAATTTLVNTDFTLQDTKRLPVNWTLNGTAQYELSFQGNMVAALDVALTKNTSGNSAAVWTNDAYTVPSFTMWADVNVDFHPSGPGVDATCPADGFALAFANTTSPNVIGGGGGAGRAVTQPTDNPPLLRLQGHTPYGQGIADTSHRP